MSIFSNKTALITGASAGIGRATATVLAKEGATIILAARREDRLSELATELHDTFGTTTFVLPLDLQQRDTIGDVLASLPPQFAVPDMLINNAGLVRGKNSLWETPPSDVDEMFDTNVKGLLEVTRCLVPKMIERGSGDIVNIGSISGHEAYAGGSVYCASKFAVRALTDALRMELLNTPIRVMHVSPGLVDTEFSTVRFRGDSTKADATYQGMDALCGQDIAECIAFSLSRPSHVSIADMIVFPTAQATATMVHRSE